MIKLNQNINFDEMRRLHMRKNFSGILGHSLMILFVQVERVNEVKSNVEKKLVKGRPSF